MQNGCTVYIFQDQIFLFEIIAQNEYAHEQMQISQRKKKLKRAEYYLHCITNDSINFMLIKSCMVNIVAFLCIIALANSHFSRKFGNLIETDSVYFDSMDILMIKMTNSVYKLTFQQTKNSTTYTYAIAQQDLNIEIDGQCYSIHPQAIVKKPSSLQFKLVKKCSNDINQINFRYLVVRPEMDEYMKIYYFEQIYTTRKLLQASTNNMVQLQSPILTLLNPRAISVLSGYYIENQKSGGGRTEYIDLSVRSTVVGSRVRIQITGESSIQQLYLYRVEIYTIVVADQFVIANLTASFQTGIIAQGESKTSVDSQYNPQTVFIGLSRFTNQHNNEKIRYSIDINPSDISVAVSNTNKYQFSYINFIYLPCNLTQLFFYQPNITCIDICPITCATYLEPYLCGQCATCFNTTYKNSSACLPCKNQCITCTSQLVCTSCIDNYLLKNNICAPDCAFIANRTYLGANLTCQPCASTCLQCSNATYCSVCNSSYFASNGQCMLNCSLVSNRTYLSSNRTCQPCAIDCLQCSNISYCSVCSSLFTASNGGCVPNCSLIANRTFLGANLTCQPCASTCLQCSNITYCSVCNVSYIASNGQCLPNCTLLSSRTFLGANQTCQLCASNCLQCSNMTACTVCNSSYFVSNGGCVPNCPLIANRTFLKDNLTCQPCASTCLQCSNATYCSVCNSSYFASGGECLPNCTLFAASTFLQNKTCTFCSKTCLTCLNLTHCLSCIDLYKLQSNACVVNCTLSLGCLQCKMASNNFIHCTKCDPGLLPYSGVCKNKCGDGSYRGSQQGCDDGNLEDGDGCSANCTVEQQYWSCVSSQGNVSACVLKRIDVLSSFVLKDPKSNSISVHFDLFPTPLILDKLQWEKGITTPTGKALLKCTKGYYDRSSSKLILEFQYEEDLSGLQAEILFDFSKVDSRVALAPSKTAKVSMVAQNNLSLSVYSAQIYLLKTVIEYISLLVAILSLLMFLCGFLSGKLIALQNLAVVQLSYLCLLSIREANPTFEALRILRVSIGSIPFDNYDYSSSVDRSFKGSYIGLGILSPPNFSYLFIFFSVIVGVVLKILHKIKCKKSKTLQIISLTFIVQITFYGLVFSSYLIFSKLMIGGISLSNSGIDNMINMVFSGVLTVIIVFYCILLIRQPIYFGIFTHAFSKFGIVSAFYILIIIQKFVSSLIIIVLKDTIFGLGIQLSIILFLFIFILIKKPYIGLDYRRQKINYIASLLIVILFLFGKIQIGNQTIENYIPLGICLMLLMSSVASVVYCKILCLLSVVNQEKMYEIQ